MKTTVPEVASLAARLMRCERALNDHKLKLLNAYHDAAESYVEPLPMTANEADLLRLLCNQFHKAKAQLWALTNLPELG